MTDFNKIENIQKYGTSKRDVISDTFELGFESLLTSCLFSIRKYCKRYVSESSEKSRLEKDIYKIKDYHSRLANKCDIINPIEVEVLENLESLFNLIQNGLFLAAYEKCLIIEAKYQKRTNTPKYLFKKLIKSILK